MRKDVTGWQIIGASLVLFLASYLFICLCFS